MKTSYNPFKNTSVSAGSLIGAILGGLLSFRSHKPTDSTFRKAGKTALFTGSGFLLGNWLERRFKR